MKDPFASSDTVRSARALKHVNSLTLAEPLALESGGVLSGVQVAYETYGQLNSARTNAVLVCHALSGDSHLAKHDNDDDPGWWDIVVGPGKAIDTNRYFVICSNILGGCRGSTGPSTTNPAVNRPYGADFPTITIGDMVEVQRRLIDHLGIDQLLAVIGGSMGGHQVLCWAVSFPERVKLAVPIASSMRLTAQALAFNVVGRNAIIRDPNFRGGQYYKKGGPAVGLALARMLGHITYLSPRMMEEKFDPSKLPPREVATEFEKRFSVGSYLAYQGDRFVERFDANSYVTLSLAMDLFNLSPEPSALSSLLSRTCCRWLVLSFSSDWLFPSRQSKDLVSALIGHSKRVTYCDVASECGHDAFLLNNDLATYGSLISAALTDTLEPRLSSGICAMGCCDADPHTVFHQHRVDYQRILELIPSSATVLDLGCGSGTLLELLASRGEATLTGIELDEKAVVTAVERGLDVIHADLNLGLKSFGKWQYDYVLLSHTLQSVRDVELLISEMLRVGRRAIVTFPNFAYHKLRTMLAEQGRAPESPGLLKYKWYNTPNIRFFSIADFEDFCAARRITVHQRVALDTEAGRVIDEDSNLWADMAIFVISSCREGESNPHTVTSTRF